MRHEAVDATIEDHREFVVSGVGIPMGRAQPRPNRILEVHAVVAVDLPTKNHHGVDRGNPYKMLSAQPDVSERTDESPHSAARFR
jgi:hypothetical protein